MDYNQSGCDNTDQYFKFGEEELAWLKKRDKKLGVWIDKIEKPKRLIQNDFFTGLVWTIAGQQISSKALQSIFARIKAVIFPLTPAKVLKNPASLRQCGLSHRKTEYICNIANLLQQNTIKQDELYNLSDNELIEYLSKLRGLGRWSAEMMLIFTFQRKNILSLGDAGIKKGINILYGDKECLNTEPSMSQDFFQKLKAIYDPFATIASFYLWEIAAKGKI